MMAVKDNKMYLITEYKKDKDSIEVEFHWENGFALKILESVYRGSDDLFGVVKTRSLQWLSNEKRWGIWRQK
jgi:hypothetical protein